MQDARIVELRSLLSQAMLADWVRLGSRLVRFCVTRDTRPPTMLSWTGYWTRPAVRLPSGSVVRRIYP